MNIFHFVRLTLKLRLFLFSNRSYSPPDHCLRPTGGGDDFPQKGPTAKSEPQHFRAAAHSFRN